MTPHPTSNLQGGPWGWRLSSVINGLGFHQSCLWDRTSGKATGLGELPTERLGGWRTQRGRESSAPPPQPSPCASPLLFPSCGPYLNPVTVSEVLAELWELLSQSVASGEEGTGTPIRKHVEQRCGCPGLAAGMRRGRSCGLSPLPTGCAPTPGS